MRLLICAGGTGGGVYPALAVLEQLGSKADAVLWVGSESGMEVELIKRTGLSYIAIPAAGLHGVGLRSLPGNLIQMAHGVRAARAVLKSFQPDVLFYTGGYVAIPMAIAARKQVSVLYVPDIEPGLALKTLARFATHITMTAEITRNYLPTNKPATVTGYPTRPELIPMAKRQARNSLGLDPNIQVLLIFGGSKGARSINQAIQAILPQLLEKTQVIHLTGILDWENVNKSIQNLPGRLRKRYHLHPYLHNEMGSAFASADLAVCRSGASTLGELPLFGLPAILIPYPHAWRYQKVNASYLAEQGAALVMDDASMSVELLPTLMRLLDDKKRLNTMSKAMHKLAVRNAAKRISEIILDVAEVRKHD